MYIRYGKFIVGEKRQFLTSNFAQTIDGRVDGSQILAFPKVGVRCNKADMELFFGLDFGSRLCGITPWLDL